MGTHACLYFLMFSLRQNELRDYLLLFIEMLTSISKKKQNITLVYESVSLSCCLSD